jgi:hypothetical protein
VEVVVVGVRVGVVDVVAVWELGGAVGLVAGGLLGGRDVAGGGLLGTTLLCVIGVDAGVSEAWLFGVGRTMK